MTLHFHNLRTESINVDIYYFFMSTYLHHCPFLHFMLYVNVTHH